jgi:hypothetical protein
MWDGGCGMNLLKSLMFVTTLLFVTFLVAAAVPDKADLGPFVATFDMGVPTGSYQIEINPPIQLKDHNEYWFRVASNDGLLGNDFIDVYIDDYGKTIDVSTNRLDEILSDGLDMWKSAAKIEYVPVASVGGRPAVTAKVINVTTGETHIYETVYSPDGVGNKGTVITDIASFYPEKETNAFLEHLQVRRQ